MLSNIENYEKVLSDCQNDIKNCEEEIIEKERELEVLKTRKQGFVELQEALSKILGSTNAEQKNIAYVREPEQQLFITSPNGVTYFFVETANGNIEIPIDAFKDLEIVEATLKLLRMVNEPLKTSQVVKALQEGGIDSSSAYFAENVRSALRTASKNPQKNGIIWSDEKLWDLANSPNVNISKPSKQKVGFPKWSKPVGDACVDILRNEENGLHLNDIHTKLSKDGIHPTVESLHSALRQDGKKRFEKVSSKTFRLAVKI